MREYWILILVSIVWLALGLVFGRLSKKTPSSDGTIIIEPTEDGERERVRFVLDMDLDEIKTKRCLIFTVENQLSQ